MPMRKTWAVVACALALGGCLPPTKDGHPWYGESYHNSPEFHALKAKQAEQRQADRERHDLQLERERRLKALNADYDACLAQNEEARRKAKVYLQDRYTWRDCSPLRRDE